MIIQPTSLAAQSNLSDPGAILDIAAGIFALVLFAISLFSWYMRRQFSLVIVALAFLLFFTKTIVRELLPQLPEGDFITDVLNFVALTL
ncbi:MAG TPA: hypothetical protein VE955_04690, partial [Candidatus Dormibacteraeota bacterium]|nr:hypothetical protein [Candidatus Dormibacteraeota bacterium]